MVTVVRIPAVERPPVLPTLWLEVWRAALRAMKDQGTWTPDLRPLLDEYVAALRGAQDARVGFESLDRLERATSRDEVDWMSLGQVAIGLPAAWDRHSRRAAALADQLCLTPRGRRASSPTVKKHGSSGRRS